MMGTSLSIKYRITDAFLKSSLTNANATLISTSINVYVFKIIIDANSKNVNIIYVTTINSYATLISPLKFVGTR
jgi:hypothetical protein